MNEEAKQKAKKALKGVGLALGLLACFLLGLGAGYCSAQNGEPTTALAKTSPKRAMSQNITFHNSTGYNLWDESEELVILTGESILATNLWFESANNNYTFTLPEGVTGYIVAEIEGAQETAKPYFALTYDLVNTGIARINLTRTEDAGRIKITNEKPSGSGDIEVLNNDLQTLLHLAPSTSGYINRSQLANQCVITTDSNQCNFGTTSMGSDLGTQVRNYNLTWDSPLEIYVSLNEPTYRINNESPYSLTYFEALPEDVTSETRGYVIQDYTNRLYINPNHPMTIVCDYKFKIQLGENPAYESMKMYGPNAVGELYEYDPRIEKHWGVVLQASQTFDGQVIKITPASDTAESTLEGTFATVGKAFTALLPLLNITLIGNITIGVLFALPLTFALISLLFKLIKK